MSMVGPQKNTDMSSLHDTKWSRADERHVTTYIEIYKNQKDSINIK